MKSMERAKQDLQRKLQELSDRQQRVERDRLHRETALSADAAEQAIEVENDEVLDSIADATAVDMAQLRHALQRIDDGLYGVCERCGDPIGAARLKVQPAATKCALCASE